MTIRGVRILLIEDDPDDFYLTSMMLERLGVPPVVWEPDAVRALATLNETDCDVCLVDHYLGTMNGIELIRQAIRAGATVPMILLTGADDWDLERSAMEAGASDFLLKGSFTPPTLERSIRHSIERARAQAATRAEEARFRVLFERSLDAMVVANELGHYVDGNQAALELFGITKEELLNLSVRDLGSDLADSEDWRERVRSNSMESDVTIRRPSGEVRVAELRAVNISTGQYFAVLRDVTERRRAEQQRLRLSAIIEAVSDGIFGLSLGGLITFWSSSAERMYGYAGDEVEGKSRSLLVPTGTIDVLAAGLKRLFAGEIVNGLEMVCRRRDGSLFEASTSLSPIRAGSNVVGIAVVTRDVSEQKRLEHRLAASDRMASVGLLAAGVAHEINNPLVAVTANLELVTERLTAIGTHHVDREIPKLMDDARTAALRIVRIVRDLGMFSHRGDDSFGAVDVNKVLESSARIAWNEISHRARLVRELGEDTAVLGNESRLGQVFLNLIVNAAHAIAEGNVTRNTIRLVSRLDAENRVVVEVSDTGGGIEPELVPHLFEPFFTSKLPGKGTGLGLSICQRIIAEHGGRIDVTSTVGVGTTVSLTLPRATTAVVTPPVARAGAAAPFVAQIMVVDDEPSVIAAVEYSLRPPHHVLAALNAADALERISAGARFDLILCDLMMPQMTGMELYKAVAAVAPAQAALMVFLTGGAFTKGAERFLASIPNPRFDKPFGAAQLRGLVNEWLRTNHPERAAAEPPPEPGSGGAVRARGSRSGLPRSSRRREP